MQMNKSLWLLYSVGCLALLVVAVTLWRGPLSSQPVANEAVLAPAGPAASVASSVPVMTSPVASAVPAVLAPESSSSPRSVAAVAFNAWAEKFASASPAARPALLAEGENLARERYRQMAQLIKEDPNWPSNQRVLSTGTTPSVSTGVWNTFRIIPYTSIDSITL